MYRTLLISCFLFACKDTSRIHSFCGNIAPGVCYAVPDVSEFPNRYLPFYRTYEDIQKNTINVGACHAGTPICDENNQIIKCLGEKLPSTEVCDNIDNNCDGSVDNNWDNQPIINWEDLSCGALGECLTTRPTCINGEYICLYTPQEEVCDNKDNDCNGLVDENILTNEFCFDGSIEDAMRGQCRAGRIGCEAGQFKCLDQVLPGPELCDGIDNNCDGVPDNTGTTNQYDIVFIIDTSGSMCDEIGAVIYAIDQYVEVYRNNPSYRWALVNMSSRAIPSPFLQVVVDFTSIETLRFWLQRLGCAGSGDEASLDALHEVCSRTNASVINLSWRTDAVGVLFAFTDEEAQSYMVPPNTQDQIIQSCLENQVLPFIWSYQSSTFRSIANNSNGIHFTLSSDPEDILNDLNSVIVTFCE